MKITLTPTDLIERCVWSKYEYFILKDMSLEEKKLLVAENKEFEIDEKSAYLIGLLKTLYTDNLVHRFNEHMIESLTIKSFAINDKKAMVTRDSIYQEIYGFQKRFPAYYKPNADIESSLKELKDYCQNIVDLVSKLPITLFQDTPCISLFRIKKLLNVHGV